jgi:UDP-N-acetyl-D-galactosamine dehydrogenase
MALDAITAKVAPAGCFIDVKSAFDALALEAAGLRIWRL